MGLSKRVLIVKLGAIGDVVMAIPAAYELHKKGVQIDWVCGQLALPLLQGFSWITAVPTDDSAILRGSAIQRIRALAALWRLLVGRKYDLCATLYYDDRFKLLSLPIRAKARISLSRTVRRGMLISGRHHSDEFTRILLQGMGWGKDGYEPVSISPIRPDQLHDDVVPKGIQRPCVALVPGGARNLVRDDALRRWPLENYVKVAEELLRRGFQVFVVGGPEDHWIDSSFDSLLVKNMVGNLTLPQLLVLFNSMDVVVTHDTGPLHLAGLTQTGIIGVFGPTDPLEKLPRKDRSIALWGGEGFACRPCYDGRNYAACKHNGCMHQVGPQMVLREIENLIACKSALQPSPFKVIVPDVS